MSVISLCFLHKYLVSLDVTEMLINSYKRHLWHIQACLQLKVLHKLWKGTATLRQESYWCKYQYILSAKNSWLLPKPPYVSHLHIIVQHKYRQRIYKSPTCFGWYSTHLQSDVLIRRIQLWWWLCSFLVVFLSYSCRHTQILPVGNWLF
jgi:hypothetical protein